MAIIIAAILSFPFQMEGRQAGRDYIKIFPHIPIL